MAHVVADTYATALFEIGVEEQILDGVFEEFKFIAETLSSEPDFYEIFKTPKISIDEKKQVIQTVFGSFSAPMVNFLKVITDKRRGDCIVDMFKSFEEQYNDYHNKAKAIVRSVVPLSDEQKAQLVEQLSKTSGYQIELENVIDPSLIGGLIIRIQEIKYEA